jgi:hypothetical protein
MNGEALTTGGWGSGLVSPVLVGKERPFLVEVVQIVDEDILRMFQKRGQRIAEMGPGYLGGGAHRYVAAPIPKHRRRRTHGMGKFLRCLADRPERLLSTAAQPPAVLGSVPHVAGSEARAITHSSSAAVASSASPGEPACSPA